MVRIKPNHGVPDSERLKSLIERLEKLHADHNAINQDMSAIYDEAKSAGYDPKYIKKVIKIRASDPDKISEENAMLKMYCDAVGVQLAFDFG